MTVPAVGDPRHERFWERRRADEEQRSAYIGQLLEQLTGSMDGLRSAMLAVPKGDVLFSGRITIPATGTYRLSFPQPFASLVVYNSTDTDLIVSSQASPEVPSIGAGVARIPSHFWRTIGMRANELTIWGPTGSIVDLEVYMRHRQPQAGPWD